MKAGEPIPFAAGSDLRDAAADLCPSRAACMRVLPEKKVDQADLTQCSRTRCLQSDMQTILLAIDDKLERGNGLQSSMQSCISLVGEKFERGTSLQGELLVSLRAIEKKLDTLFDGGASALPGPHSAPMGARSGMSWSGGASGALPPIVQPLLNNQCEGEVSEAPACEVALLEIIKTQEESHDAAKAGGSPWQCSASLAALPEDMPLQQPPAAPLLFCSEVPSIACSRMTTPNPFEGARKAMSKTKSRLLALHRSDSQMDDESKKVRAYRTSVQKDMDIQLKSAGVSSDGDPSKVHQLVHNIAFDFASTAIILTNSVLIGVEVQYSSQNRGSVPEVFGILNQTYAVIFLVELALRFISDGIKEFLFKSKDRLWNWFDVFITLASILEIMTHLIASTRGDANLANLRVLRVLKITRLLRIFRIPRVIRYVAALRTLVHSILATLRSLVWAMVLMTLIMYVYGILFTASIGGLLEEGLLGDDAVLYWGSLGTSVMTLFKSISGGVSWQDVVIPLSNASWMLEFAFVSYITFTLFAVLNVVTGVFCNSAIESSQADPDLIAHNLAAKKKRCHQQMKELFALLDTQQTGSITLGELEVHLSDQLVQAQFHALGIETDDAWTFFKLMDTDGSSSLEWEEFVIGCLQLSGMATALDISLATHENRWLMKQVHKLFENLDSRLQPV